MITTATLIQHFKPFNAVFRETRYDTFRQTIDAKVGQRHIRTYRLRGALLLTDARHQVVGKIDAATVDDWGMAQDASYHLPVETARITAVQRVYLRGLRGAEVLLRWAKQPSRSAMKKRRSNTPHASCTRRGDRRGDRRAVKWTTLRLAG